MSFLKHIIAAVFLIVIAGCHKSVRTGLDNIDSYGQLFCGKRIGIIANHTAYDSKGRFILDVFDEMEDVKVTAVFTPEHGLEGAIQAGEHVSDRFTDVNVPIYSLYGRHKQPTQQMLEDVDILVFDIQDIGCRYYTYISTMALAMESAAKYDKQFVVLDRPNPINAKTVQGNVLDVNFASFVGLYPIPVRYGMTVGELATMFNSQDWLKSSSKVNLIVIPMTNYKRSYWYEQTGLKFIKPSPNMPSIDAALMYPGTCLLEGTNVSEGRGTDEPFLIFGAPWINAEDLTVKLNNLRLSGIKFTPLQFTPEFSKYQGQICFGSKIVITDRNSIDPFYIGISIIDTISRSYPGDFRWKEKHFDRLCGTDGIRKSIINSESLQELKRQSERDMSDFLKMRRNHLLY